MNNENIVNLLMVIALCYASYILLIISSFATKQLINEGRQMDVSGMRQSSKIDFNLVRNINIYKSILEILAVYSIIQYFSVSGSQGLHRELYIGLVLAFIVTQTLLIYVMIKLYNSNLIKSIHSVVNTPFVDKDNYIPTLLLRSILILSSMLILGYNF